MFIPLFLSVGVNVREIPSNSLTELLRDILQFSTSFWHHMNLRDVPLNLPVFHYEDLKFLIYTFTAYTFYFCSLSH